MGRKATPRVWRDWYVTEAGGKMQKLCLVTEGEKKAREKLDEYLAGLASERQQTNQPGKVGQAGCLLFCPGLLDHRGCEIDTRDMAGDLSQAASDQAGATSDIQHGIVRADLCHVDEELVRLIVGMGRHLRERHRLPSELVKNQLPVCFGWIVHRLLRCSNAALPQEPANREAGAAAASC